MYPAIIAIKYYFNQVLASIPKLWKSGKKLFSKKHVLKVLSFSLILILCDLCLNLSGKNLLLKEQLDAISKRYVQHLKESKPSRVSGGQSPGPQYTTKNFTTY